MPLTAFVYPIISCHINIVGVISTISCNVLKNQLLCIPPSAAN